MNLRIHWFNLFIIWRWNVFNVWKTWILRKWGLKKVIIIIFVIKLKECAVSKREVQNLHTTFSHSIIEEQAGQFRNRIEITFLVLDLKVLKFVRQKYIGEGSIGIPFMLSSFKNPTMHNFSKSYSTNTSMTIIQRPIE